MTGRVEQRKRETRARIVQAAFDLFAEKGVEGTTVAEISEAADIGKGTFFTYFRSKDDVFADIGTLMLEMMSSGVSDLSASGGTVTEQLLNAVIPAIEWHEKNPRLSRLSITVLMRTPSTIDVDAANISALEALLAALVREGQAKGEFREDVDADGAATVILGLYFMSILRWHRAEARGPLKERVLGGLAVVMKGLAR